MESITKPAQVLQPPENSILHPVEAYLDRRYAQEPVHLVQYDTGIPVLTVALFQKDKPYAVPAGAAVNLRLSKPDGTCVYDPVLGLSQDRRTVYVQVSRQMTAAAGLANAILEILLNGGVVGTASFLLFLEANPVTDEAILSSGEFKSLDDYVHQTEASAASAQEAAERAQTLRDSIEMDYEYIEGARKEAQDHAEAAENSVLRAAEHVKQAGLSAGDAAAKAREAGESARSALDMARAAQSYAVGGTQTRKNEDADNAKYYYDQAKRISQGLNGALLPMGTIPFAQLKNQTKEPGYMYNISDAFTTDATFKEGSGHAYPAGTNVYRTADGFWDCLAGVLPQDIHLTGDAVGTARFNGSQAITINTTRRGCIVGQFSSTAGDNTWYKFASMSISNSYQDSGIIFLVRPAMDLDSNPSGILQVHVRALEDKTVATAKTVFRWLLVNDRITLTDFCMVYSATSPVTVELWVRCDKWAVYSFEVLSESSIRTTRENGWTLYNAVELNGQKAPTEGYTRINSTISTPMFGDLTMSGDARKIKYNSGKRMGSVISLYAGDENGSGIVIGDGGRTIIGGGEAAYNLRNALGGSDFDEQLHLANDGPINLHTNCQTISQRRTFTFQNDGRFSGVANPTAATDAANKQYVDLAVAGMRISASLMGQTGAADAASKQNAVMSREIQTFAYTDLNDLKEVGLYPYADTYRNIPAGAGGVVCVLPYSDIYITQIATVNSTAGMTGFLYARTHGENGWNPWAKII